MQHKFLLQILFACSTCFGHHYAHHRECRWGNWWRTWERLNAGENNGKLPLRICPGCSVPELYQSTDWVLVSAQTGPRAEYL